MLVERVDHIADGVLVGGDQRGRSPASVFPDADARMIIARRTLIVPCLPRRALQVRSSPPQVRLECLIEAAASSALRPFASKQHDHRHGQQTTGAKIARNVALTLITVVWSPSLDSRPRSCPVLLARTCSCSKLPSQVAQGLVDPVTRHDSAPEARRCSAWSPSQREQLDVGTTRWDVSGRPWPD